MYKTLINKYRQLRRQAQKQLKQVKNKTCKEKIKAVIKMYKTMNRGFYQYELIHQSNNK